MGNRQRCCSAVVQLWRKSWYGGDGGPDGFSLHLSEADRKAYVDAYLDGMPGLIPEEYSVPTEKHYAIEVSIVTLTVIAAGRHGIRCSLEPKVRRALGLG